MWFKMCMHNAITNRTTKSCALGELDSPPEALKTRLSSRLIYAVQIRTVFFLQEINPLRNYIVLIPDYPEKGETWQKKVTKAMRDDFKRCEELVNKIMEECDVEIPLLTWIFMTYDELLDLEKELKNGK